MQDYRKLHAWQKSHSLALRTYAVTSTFPRHELFGLTSQMRRASVSAPANIAEGCYRDSTGVQAQSLKIALGSTAELEYYVILVRDLNLISAETSNALLIEVADVKRVITGLLKSVESQLNRKSIANRKGER